jgi:hypothetical protein
MSCRRSIFAFVVVGSVLASAVVGCGLDSRVTRFRLTSAVDGSGSVAVSPAGQACDGCAAGVVAYQPGTIISLTATPASGQSFVGFSGDCTGTTPCSLTMDTDHQVTAHFAPIAVHGLTVTRTGPGLVASTPTGIFCDTDCAASFGEGDEVELSATPFAGAIFAGWGGDCSGTGPCRITIDGDKSVTAAFVVTTDSVSTTKIGDGAGTIQSAPAGIDCGATCTASFPTSTTVLLTATPDANSSFAGWSGDCAGHGVCAVAIDSAHAVTARFDRLAFPLSVGLFGAGAVTASDGAISCGATCQASYLAGNTVTLTAAAAAGNTFSGWSGACAGTGTCVVTMTQAQWVVAGFAPDGAATSTPTALDTTLTNGPPNPSRLASATFWFAGGGTAASFVCAVDGAAPAPCTSPLALSGLADGAHTFTVAAVDAAGTADATPARYDWTVDTVPPVTRLTQMPPDPSNSTSPSFSFSADKPGAIFTCRLDAQAPARCTSPFAFTSLPDGAHRFVVAATDAAGNTDPSPASYSWTVDTAPPHTMLASWPSNPSNAVNPAFTFTTSEGAGGMTFACALDGAAPVPCASPWTALALADGAHTLSVAATDAAGNTDSSPPSVAWTVDTVAPVISNLTVTPPFAKAGTLVTISFSVSKTLAQRPNVSGTSFNAQVAAPDGSNDYVATYNVGGYESQGLNAVKVNATDTAGNTGMGNSTVTFDFTAPTFNVAVNPGTVGAGAPFTVTVTASEPLQSAPSLTVAGRTLSPTGASGQTYTFTAATQAGDSEGSQGIAVTGTDRAGNTGNGAGSVTFKLHVGVSRPAITLLRTPVGAAKSVVGAAGAADAGSTIQVYADAALSQPLGSATAAFDGSFSAAAGTADMATAYIVVTDTVGNVSAPTQPGQVTATLDFQGVAAGAAPHTAFVRDRADELAPPDAAPEGSGDGVALSSTALQAIAQPDGTGTAASLAPQVSGWLGAKPPAGYEVAMAYDPLAQRARAFINSSGMTTWSWDGSAWSLSSMESTTNWYGAAMAWDGVNQRLMLWAGGSGAPPTTNYGWNGSSWQALYPVHTPGPRSNPALAWDSDRQVVVLFGGDGWSDTWEWNGTDWTRISATGGPSGGQPVMAYDGTRHYTLLIAAQSSYAWDGTVWTPLTTSGPASYGAGGGAMAWDAARGVVVLHNNVAGETWEWNGAWTKVAAQNEPGPVNGAALTFDAARGKILLQGGFGRAESYTWDGTAWTRVNGPSPFLNQTPALAYDDARAQTVLFGWNSSPATGTTWTWNGGDWSQVEASNDLIGARSYVSLASGGGTVLLYGGTHQSGQIRGDAYTWDGTAWTAVNAVSPGPRTTGGLAWDPWHASFVLYGGSNATASVTDTWLFAGGSWSQPVVTTNPGTRIGPALIAFPPSQSVILQGGSGFTDTWSWNGTAWAPVPPIVAGRPGPSVSTGTAVAYDPGRRRLVLLTPNDSTNTWEWDGGSWRKAANVPVPGRYNSCSMAWQAQASQAVLFCGGSWVAGVTWLYAPPRYPAQVFTLHVGSTSAPTAVSVQAVAGGSGGAIGGASKGARLLAWNFARQLWADIGASTASDTDTTNARTIAPVPLAAAQYVSNGQITLMVLPANPADKSTTSVVTTDYVQAQVTYPVP